MGGRSDTGAAARAALLLLAVIVVAPRVASALPGCGDPTASAGVGATDALLTLKSAVGQDVVCLPCACDVNADGAVTTADALAVLRRAVGSLRYLSCFANLACTTPSPKIDGILDTSVAPMTPGDILGVGLATDEPSQLRFFGGGLSIEVPAVSLATNRIGAAAPPLADGVGAPAGGFRVQALQGLGNAVVASNALEGILIEPAPTPPGPAGNVTADYLLGAVEHAQGLLEVLPPGSDMAVAVATLLDALQTLRTEVVALRDEVKDSASLGSRDGVEILLTREHLAQVDAMVLASLSAQAGLPDSAALTTTPSGTSGVSRAMAAPALEAPAGSDCRQQQSGAYIDALLHEPDTVTQRHGYFTAPCVAEAARTSYAVVLAPAALATGILALTGVTVAGVALALPAAAVLYVSIAGAGGLIAVGGALAGTSEDAVALVKQGVAQAESTMQNLVTGFVLPDVVGPLYDMAGAVKDLSEAFSSFTPSPTTTLPPTTSSTFPSTTTTLPTSSSTTLQPPGCYCCCAFWDGCPPCTNFTCLELASPQSPPDNEAFCTPYSQEFCDSDLCQSP